jgi:hypothetical protein
MTNKIQEILNSPKKVLVVAIVFSISLIVASLPFLRTTTWSCSSGVSTITEYGIKCGAFEKYFYNNLSFLDWFISMKTTPHEISDIRFITLISVSLIICLISFVYFYISKSSNSKDFDN